VTAGTVSATLPDVCVFKTSGYVVNREANAAAAWLLQQSGVTAVTGPVIFGWLDGLQTGQWHPSALTIASVFANPRGVPPVWLTRASGGARDHLMEDPLDAVDAWIRCLNESPGTVALLDIPVAERTADVPSAWEQLLNQEGYLLAFRRLLERHRALVEQNIGEILILRETEFAALRAEHTTLVCRHEEAVTEIANLSSTSSPSQIQWGSFNRTRPIANDWGYGRGGPVDRRYIRDFIAAHCSDIRGCVLEIQEDDLTREFGGIRVERGDVLDVSSTNSRATVIADLRGAGHIPDGRYDCIVLTQTAHIIDDMPAVIRECSRLLTPNGVLLATFPSLSRVCLEYGPHGDFWRVTAAGARALLSAAFEGVTIEASGNVKTAIAFLHGLGEGELTEADYALHDPYNPVLIGARAQKRRAGGATGVRGVVLAYHRIEQDSSGRLDLNVVPQVFQEHLSWLEDNASIVPLEDLLELDPERLPPNAVALTFDDGYVHHLESIAPLLASRRIPAAYFVTTAGLHQAAEHWWDLFERADVPDSEVAQLHDRFVHASLECREQFMADLRKRAGQRATGISSRRPLLLDEVRRLAAIPGVTIGAHSVHHLHLPDQPDDVKRSELLVSRRSLESAIERPVRLFAYPYGGVDRRTAQCARQEFRWAMGCHAGVVRQSFDAGNVPRLDVKEWFGHDFGERVTALRRTVVPGERVRLLP
jgi:peptidoglycan/xylan/chitin deacetylase (PgdA/CDA1 family)